MTKRTIAGISILLVVVIGIFVFIFRPAFPIAGVFLAFNNSCQQKINSITATAEPMLKKLNQITITGVPLHPAVESVTKECLDAQPAVTGTRTANVEIAGADLLKIIQQSLAKQGFKKSGVDNFSIDKCSHVGGNTSYIRQDMDILVMFKENPEKQCYGGSYSDDSKILSGHIIRQIEITSTVRYK